MIYSQGFYLVFSLAAIVLTAGQSAPRRAQIFLLLANLAFLEFVFYWRQKSLLLLLALLAGNFAVLRLMERRPSARAGLHYGLSVFNVAALAYFSYPSLFEILGFERFAPVALVGLAWLVLKLLHLSAEVRSGSLKVRLEPLPFFNYLLFFPAYFSGPIARYDQFYSHFTLPRTLSREQVYHAARRIILGLFQSRVVAFFLNFFSLATMSDAVLPSLTASRLFVAVVAFGLWLYFTFSGITDIAIGLGCLLGYSLPENFHKPFLALNLQEFWQRWHMSLLAWARDYIFLPLQIHLGYILPGFPGVATALSVLFGFCVLGLWHGDGMHFLLYGLYHGAGMTIFLGYARSLRAPLRRLCVGTWREIGLKVLAWLLTWNYICLGWFFYLGKEHILYHWMQHSMGLLP